MWWMVLLFVGIVLLGCLCYGWASGDFDRVRPGGPRPVPPPLPDDWPRDGPINR